MNTPDQSAADLAFATKLQEQTMMPQMPTGEQPQEAQNSPKNAPETAQKPKAEKLPQEDSGFQDEVLNELSSLRKEVEMLLKDEKVEDKNEKKDDTGEKE